MFPSHWMLVSFSTNDLEQVRCGWTIPTYVGPAVVRNRLRRWGREYFRLNAKEFLGLDLNMVFRRQEKKFYRDLDHEELDQVFEKLRLKIKRPQKSGGSGSSVRGLK